MKCLGSKRVAMLQISLVAMLWISLVFVCGSAQEGVEFRAVELDADGIFGCACVSMSIAQVMTEGFILLSCLIREWLRDEDNIGNLK